MNDVLPSQATKWREIEDLFEKIIENYGYKEIRTPIVENTALFNRSVGESTDIVEKEMYSFIDALNGEKLSLRPENTASVVRAAIEHNLLYDGPKRFWYRGPMFRHERPQRGRYRQFHQIGVEALGFPGSEADAELILMCASLWRSLGIVDALKLELNCLGSLNERTEYRHALLSYFHDNRAIIELDETAKRRFISNPLRILDSKKEVLQPLISQAPNILKFLGKESQNHFEKLKQILIDNGIAFQVNPRLVRGLDYYNLTVFEWITDSLGAQGTVAAGGRYDSLIAKLGGADSPGCGWAVGVERLLELLSNKDSFNKIEGVFAYIVYDDEKRLSLAIRVAELLRRSNLSAMVYFVSHLNNKLSLKSQFKQANRNGARYVLVLGEKEEKDGSITVKPMRMMENGELISSEQSTVKLDQLLLYLKDAVKS